MSEIEMTKAAADVLAEIERLDRARGETRQPFGPNNPPRLRKPGESLADYRAAMGWGGHEARHQPYGHYPGGDAMSGPSLADDSFVDKAIATASYCLWALQDGEYTNAVQLLVRPVDIRSDESGGHPGETFVMLTITREEVRAILNELNRDWDQFAAFAGSLD